MQVCTVLTYVNTINAKMKFHRFSLRPWPLPPISEEVCSTAFPLSALNIKLKKKQVVSQLPNVHMNRIHEDIDMNQTKQ